MNIITILAYHCPEAPERLRWLALAVLPNGDPWSVNCWGPTREKAMATASDLYAREIEKKRKEAGWKAGKETRQ